MELAAFASSPSDRRVRHRPRHAIKTLKESRSDDTSSSEPPRPIAVPICQPRVGAPPPEFGLHNSGDGSTAIASWRRTVEAEPLPASAASASHRAHARRRGQLRIEQHCPPSYRGVTGARRDVVGHESPGTAPLPRQPLGATRTTARENRRSSLRLVGPARRSSCGHRSAFPPGRIKKTRKSKSRPKTALSSLDLALVLRKRARRRDEGDGNRTKEHSRPFIVT